MQLVLSPRAKRLLKWFGYPVLGLFSFLMALQLTFPYSRVKDKIIEVMAPKYDMTVNKVSRGLMPGTVSLEDVTLKSRPSRADEQVTTLFFKEITVHVNLLTAISSFGGTRSADFDIRVGSGSIDGTVTLTKATTRIALSIDGVSAETVPGLPGFVGLPVGGKIVGSLDVDLPEGDWRKAETKAKLSCRAACTIGDGVAKIHPKARPGSSRAIFAQEGLTVARLFLKTWAVEFDIAKGKGTLKKFDVESDDGELYADLHLQMQHKLTDAVVVAGCIKFKPSENLKKREPKFYDGLHLTGAPLGGDGYFYIRLSGTLDHMRRLPQLCDLSGSNGDMMNAGDEGGGGRIGTGGITTRPTIRGVPQNLRRAPTLPAARPTEPPRDLTPPTPTPTPTPTPSPVTAQPKTAAPMGTNAGSGSGSAGALGGSPTPPNPSAAGPAPMDHPGGGEGQAAGSAGGEGQPHDEGGGGEGEGSGSDAPIIVN